MFIVCEEEELTLSVIPITTVATGKAGTAGMAGMAGMAKGWASMTRMHAGDMWATCKPYVGHMWGEVVTYGPSVSDATFPRVSPANFDSTLCLPSRPHPPPPRPRPRLRSRLPPHPSPPPPWQPPPTEHSLPMAVERSATNS